MEPTVIQGDIADQSADALLNAAGTSLRMGSGVAGALRRGANGPINEAAMAQEPVDLGGVAVTDAFELDADRVIHAAAMPHYGDGRATEQSIRAATRTALERADDLGCESLVLPMLGGGVAGSDLVEGARVMTGVVRDHGPEVPSDVRLIGYSDAEDETIRSAADGVS
jgi:O-acetyl-ADP-ribose deacetylase (regulator of RNase III)